MLLLLACLLACLRSDGAPPGDTRTVARGPSSSGETREEGGEIRRERRDKKREGRSEKREEGGEKSRERADDGRADRK